MAKKRNLEPESSQPVEPPPKQHRSEAQQENVSSSLIQSILATPDFLHILHTSSDSYSQRRAAYWRRELEALGTPAIAFERSSTSPYGRTNSVFGHLNVFGTARLANVLVSILAKPDFFHADYAFRKCLVEAFWKNPAAIAQECLGIRPFGRTTPTSIFTLLKEARGFGSTVPTMTSEQLEAIEKSQESGSTGAPAFGAIRVYEGRQSPPISITSCPTITEKHGGTSGQTAKLESISAMPAYNYERFEVTPSYWERMKAFWRRELEALGTPAIAFEQSSTSPFGLTNSEFGQHDVFGAAHPASVLVSILATPDFLHASYDIRKHLVEAFWKNPAAIAQKFRGIRPFGRATPTRVWKQSEEAGGFGSTVPTMTWEQFEAIKKSQAFGATNTPAFGAISGRARIKMSGGPQCRN